MGEATVAEPTSEALARETRTNWEVYQRLKAMGVIGDTPAPLTGQPKMSIPIPIEGEAKLKLDLQESQRRYEEIRQEAEKNQRYYCDQSRRTKKPWFQNPRSNKMYSEYVLVTPEMAEVALRFNNNPRKRIKRRSVEAYSRDMQAARWIPTSESLDLDYNGEWYNGQHRFNAVLLAGVPVIFYVSWNNLIEARFGQDQGVVRSASEKMSMVLANNVGTKLPAVARAMMRGLNNSGVKFSHAEVTQFAVLHGPIIEWVCKRCPGLRADVQAVFAKAALWYGIDRIEPFVKRVADVMFKSVNDPARRLYEFLHQGRKTGAGSGVLTYKKSLSAVKHFILNREIRALYESDRDIFEWGPNWSVPPKGTAPEDDGDDESVVK